MHDAKIPIRNKDIVGWKIWYSDGSSYSSLDGWKAENLPERDVQILLIYHLRTDGKRGLWRTTYTHYEYRIPFSDRVLYGDWTDMENHDRIYAMAVNEWWT